MNTFNKRYMVALIAIMSLMMVNCSKKKADRTRQVVPQSQSARPFDSNSQGQVIDSQDDQQNNGFDQDQGQPLQQGVQQQQPQKFSVNDDYEDSDDSDEKYIEPNTPTGEGEDPYPVIHKDVLYEDKQPTTSNGRMNEFGAVVSDDPRWFPGLPDYPAGHPQSKLKTIFTGGVSSVEGGYKFTDMKSDGLMAYLIQTFDNIKPEEGKFHKDIQKESRKLAERIMDVRVEVDKYTKGIAKVEVEFADGDVKKPVRIFLQGTITLSSNGRALVDLDQVDIKGDKDLKFTGRLICTDSDGGCQNALIRLHQKNTSGETCRVALIVHRFGDAHITMSDQDRLRYEVQANDYHRYLAEYMSNSAYNACQANKKRTDIPSRLKNHFLAYCGDASYKKLPAAKTIGIKAWAAAYGASEFKLVLKDEDHWTGLAAGKDTVISGPLVWASHNSPVYTKQLSKSGANAAYIKSAHLVNNDGGGNLNLLLRFPGPDESEMQLSVTSMIRNTEYLSNVTPQEKIEEEPRG